MNVTSFTCTGLNFPYHHRVTEDRHHVCKNRWGSIFIYLFCIAIYSACWKKDNMDLWYRGQQLKIIFRLTLPNYNALFSSKSIGILRGCLKQNTMTASVALTAHYLNQPMQMKGYTRLLGVGGPQLVCSKNAKIWLLIWIFLCVASLSLS